MKALNLIVCCIIFRRSNKVQIRNFPSHIGAEEIQELVRSYGPVQKCELGKVLNLVLTLKCSETVFLILFGFYMPIR